MKVVEQGPTVKAREGKPGLRQCTLTNTICLMDFFFVILSFNTFDNVHNFIDSKNILYILSCQSNESTVLMKREPGFN